MACVLFNFQMLHSKPKISVVIPTYNRHKLLRNAISSVLNQAFGDFEIIIVDDYIDGNLHTNFYDSRIIYIKLNKRKGLNYCRNLGIHLAKSDIVTFLDDDDILPEGTLEEYYNTFLKLDDSYGCIFPDYKNRFSNYICVYKMEELPYAYKFKGRFNNNPIEYVYPIIMYDGIAGAFRKKVLLEAGGFPDLKQGEDSALKHLIYLVGYKWYHICKILYIEGLTPQSKVQKMNFEYSIRNLLKIPLMQKERKKILFRLSEHYRIHNKIIYTFILNIFLTILLPFCKKVMGKFAYSLIVFFYYFKIPSRRRTRFVL